MAILFIDDRKAARIIPHGPADAVLFQRHAHVLNPGDAISGRRKAAIGAEFITSERDLILCSPRGSYANLPINSGRVPTFFTITKQISTRRFILNRVDNSADAFRT